MTTQPSVATPRVEMADNAAKEHTVTLRTADLTTQLASGSVDTRMSDKDRDRAALATMSAEIEPSETPAGAAHAHDRQRNGDSGFVRESTRVRAPMAYDILVWWLPRAQMHT